MTHELQPNPVRFFIRASSWGRAAMLALSPNDALRQFVALHAGAFAGLGPVRLVVEAEDCQPVLTANLEVSISLESEVL